MNIIFKLANFEIHDVFCLKSIDELNYITVETSAIIDDFVVSLVELAGTMDFHLEGGDPSCVLTRVDKALARIRGIWGGLLFNAQELLFALGELEAGERQNLPSLRLQALILCLLVVPRGPLDQLLDFLDSYRDLTAEVGDRLRLSARMDLLDLRNHAYQININYCRIIGKNLL